MSVQVSVTGLNDEMHNNVVAGLTLERQKDNPRLTDYQIKRLLKKAKQEIATALEPFGYYHPQVDISSVNVEGSWAIIFDVAPGEPVLLSDVKLEMKGPGRFEKQLKGALASFPLQNNDILDHRLYESGKKDILVKAATAGYKDAEFAEHTISVDRQNNTAGISLTLDTGPLYFFGPTTFDADFISHGLLHRMMPYREGDPFSSRSLVLLRQALFNTDYFKDVEVKSGEADATTHSIPIQVTLGPKKRHKYKFGVGYGTDTGARATIDWINRRFNRYGHQFNFTLQPSERKSYFGGVYTIPIKDPTKDRVSVPLKWEKEDFDNTETEKRSTAISYDHIWNNGEYSLYVQFLDEDFDTGLDTGHATLLMPGLKTTLRIADNRLVTKYGIRATVNLTGAAEDVVSDASFLQASLASKGIYSFWEKWRIIGLANLGRTVVDNTYDLPPSLRFYAGGDQSVRGYAYKSIGPRNPSGDVIGGRYLLTYSVELERKISDSWSAALFFDSGDAFNSLSDLAMKNGAGVGLRWNASFGQVRFDIANALSDDVQSWRIHFNVGADL